MQTQVPAACSVRCACVASKEIRTELHRDPDRRVIITGVCMTGMLQVRACARTQVRMGAHDRAACNMLSQEDSCASKYVLIFLTISKMTGHDLSTVQQC